MCRMLREMRLRFMRSKGETFRDLLSGGEGMKIMHSQTHSGKFFLRILTILYYSFQYHKDLHKKHDCKGQIAMCIALTKAGFILGRALHKKHKRARLQRLELLQGSEQGRWGNILPHSRVRHFSFKLTRTILYFTQVFKNMVRGNK